MENILKTTQTAEISRLLNEGKVGILPTDTIYGLHCKSQDLKLIDRVHTLKSRPENMPFITLISDQKDLLLFGIELNAFEKEQIAKFWPGPNTLIFKTNTEEFRSFRITANDFLQSILPLTGPLISTSANISTKPFAKNIAEAVNYFGDSVDFYVDSGELNNKPSSVYKIEDGNLIKIR